MGITWYNRTNLDSSWPKVRTRITAIFYVNTGCLVPAVLFIKHSKKNPNTVSSAFLFLFSAQGFRAEEKKEKEREEEVAESQKH